MITKISKDLRGGADYGWLKTNYLFSFADYFDPKNMGFGAMRVFNDDYIAAKNGFPPHQHANMEIITIVLEGKVSHEDSIGNKTTIRAGEVQRMSAGVGVTHAEENKNENPLHLYQIWIFPKEQNTPPSYEQRDFSSVHRTNVLLPLVSDKNLGDALVIHSDATIYDSHLESDKTIELQIESSRGIFIYPRSGSLLVNKTETIGALDQARVTGETAISIKALADSEFILIDVPA